MPFFAELDQDNIVKQVVEFESLEVCPSNERWVETFKYDYQEATQTFNYNSSNPRKNFASVGDTFDAERNCFIPPKTHASWVLDEISCRWEPPLPHPADGKRYYWNESTVAWVEDVQPDNSVFYTPPSSDCVDCN